MYKSTWKTKRCGLSIAIADDDFTVFQRLSSTSADSVLAIAFYLVQFYLPSFIPWWNASCRPYLVCDRLRGIFSCFFLRIRCILTPAWPLRIRDAHGPRVGIESFIFNLNIFTVADITVRVDPAMSNNSTLTVPQVKTSTSTSMLSVQALIISIPLLIMIFVLL